MHTCLGRTAGDHDFIRVLLEIGRYNGCAIADGYGDARCVANLRVRVFLMAPTATWGSLNVGHHFSCLGAGASVLGGGRLSAVDITSTAHTQAGVTRPQPVNFLNSATPMVMRHHLSGQHRLSGHQSAMRCGPPIRAGSVCLAGVARVATNARDLC